MDRAQVGHCQFFILYILEGEGGGAILSHTDPVAKPTSVSSPGVAVISGM